MARGGTASHTAFYSGTIDKSWHYADPRAMADVAMTLPQEAIPRRLPGTDWKEELSEHGELNWNNFCQTSARLRIKLCSGTPDTTQHSDHSG